MDESECRRSSGYYASSIYEDDIFSRWMVRILTVILIFHRKWKTRNSSGDEIANVNFLYDEIVHVLQNTIDSCINSAISTRLCIGTHVFTKFSEITQYNGDYVVQDHSRSPILVPIESPYTTSYQ